MNKGNKKRYGIWYAGEDTAIYKVSDTDNGEEYLTFQEAKKELRRFAASMVYRYGKLKSSAYHLKETDIQ